MNYRILIAFAVFSFTSRMSFARPTAALDNLQKIEIAQVKRTIEKLGRFSKDAYFVSMSPKDPLKSEYKNKNAKRIITVVMYEPVKNEMTEIDVMPKTETAIAIQPMPGKQPIVVPEEFGDVARIVKADSCWQNAIKARGFDPQDFDVDGWAPGILSKEERASGARILRGVTYFKGEFENMYAHPVEGIKVSVDMNKRKVIECTDVEHVAIPFASGDLTMLPKKDQRKGLNAVVLAQPGGPSYRLNGQHVQWQNWDFDFKFDHMKGLQLFNVSYIDGSKQRSVAAKIGASEMVVPYGDADPAWSFRNALDIGEYGLGSTVHSLKRGIDAPSIAKFFPIHVPDRHARVTTINNAIAIYERPAGLLWKHDDQDNGVVNIKNGQELVMYFMSTIGNYDYGINYIFSLDGSLRVEVVLTGILLAKGTNIIESKCNDGCISLVAKQIIAPPHTHFFSFRIDMDVDGEKNSAYQMDLEVEKSAKLNPMHNKFYMKNTVLKDESEARRDVNLLSARMWKIANQNVSNDVGHPTGYAIALGETAAVYLGERSPIRKRAQFIDYDIWFTRFHDGEQSAAGDYPNQSENDLGLAEFVANNESLINEDVVAWCTLGIVHHPRPEEWPILSVHRASLTLTPLNFFSRNPTMDLPLIRR